MTPAESGPGQNMSRVFDLLGEALELPPEGRASFLDAECGDDESLRAEVESLLVASEDSDSYFGGLADRAGMTLSDDTRSPRIAWPEPDSTPPDLIGTRVGQYRVLESLGQGGMASVYLAERDGDGFTQRVALKLVSQRFSDPLIQRRSNEERRILARLEHRGIARLIDGGVTSEGYPFYAMEYVEGTDVLTYADATELSLVERLRLFLDVCAPVQFAHERLVIHCDLKPNNIFVSPEGHVKLLDFGVARLIDPESAGSGTTGLWFTPAYASPEQVRREPPGTASDVYSLGVLLYELLTGHRPYHFGSRFRDEIVRTVGELVPPRPSEVVTQPGQRTVDGERRTIAATELSAARGMTPDSMRKRLKGDLDAIVMKALAKDPEDRYSTAEQLAADIRRHLGHELVTSVAPTPAYRARKFVRRNRTAVVASSIVSLAVAGGLGATMWQADRATKAADAAVVEAEKAQRVADLMSELFRLSDPSQALGDTVTARDMLDRGTERILEEFGDQPVVQADLLSEVAQIYRNLGLYSRAEPLVTTALELRTEEFGPMSLEASESLIDLGVLKSDLSDRNQSIEVLSRAIDIREPLLVDPDELLIQAKSTLGWATRNAGDYERAARLFDEALSAQRSIDSSDVAIADLMFGQASALHDDGMLEQADSVFREVLSAVDAESRPTPNAVSALSRVGMVRRLREQYQEADPLLRSAVSMGATLYGPAHASVLEVRKEFLLNQLALGYWEEAEAEYRRAIQDAVRSLGEGHEVTAGLQEGFGRALEYLGRYDESADFLKLALQEKVLRHRNQDHAGIVASLVSVARSLTLGGREREALDYLVQSESMNERLGASRSVYTISSERSRGLLALQRGEYDVAEVHLLRALEIAESVLSRPSHRYITGAKYDYAKLLVAEGRAAEAITLLTEVESLIVERTQRPDHPLIAEARALRARAER